MHGAVSEYNRLLPQCNGVLTYFASQAPSHRVWIVIYRNELTTNIRYRHTHTSPSLFLQGREPGQLTSPIRHLSRL